MRGKEVKIMIAGNGEPVFPVPGVLGPTGGLLIGYMLLGLVVGAISVLVTRAVYAVEDAFERLPINWMWWPALGAVAVGAIGYFAPHTLGVGYDNITDLLSGDFALGAAACLCSLKFVSWCISLGSGTSGGTLAPLRTIGGGLGIVWGHTVQRLLPGVGFDLRIAALVGMTAMFAGAARALMASVVFGFETTQQPLGFRCRCWRALRGVVPGFVLFDAADDHDRKNLAARRPYASRI